MLKHLTHYYITYLNRNSFYKIKYFTKKDVKELDTPYRIEDLLSVARAYPKKKLQVTWRPVNMPEESRNDKVSVRTRQLQIHPEMIGIIISHFEEVGTILYKLPHGAIVYDIDGQNFCLSNCLTIQPNLDEVRQIIYVNGEIIYDWQYRGAILL